jgi:hypothetical protein
MRMKSIWEVTFEDIERLNDKQLAELLHRLLRLEAKRNGIAAPDVLDVPQKITVADGGEDGRIRWTGTPDKTEFIPLRFTIFQCKATNLQPAHCESEITRPKTDELKPMVEEVLDAGGAYVLFMNYHCTEEMRQDRVEGFRKAIRRARKSYAESADIHVFDANRIADWVNHFPVAVLNVFSYIKRAMPYAAQTWDMWSSYEENSFTYVMDDSLESNISRLRALLSNTGKVARVVGVSGLGKTRMALETFRPPNLTTPDLSQQVLSDKVVYVDAASTTTENLVATAVSWRSSGFHAILVVDNCEVSLHNALAREAARSDSNFSLLTLDYTLEKPSDGNPFIQLEQVSDDVIKGIIKQSYPTLPDADAARIADFAHGFPQMAVLLGGAWLNDAPEMGNLQDDTLLRKLLWGRGQGNDVEYKVISACALFDHFGFKDDVIHHRQYMAQKLCQIDNQQFYTILQSFIKKGIIDKRGSYLRVTPRPLAIRLAADWWTQWLPEHAVEILTDTELPSGLATALCDQMAKLDFLQEAKDHTRRLCGDQAPFGQAEVLESEHGSRLFRSLVEVNPEATVSALNRVFGHRSREQLLGVVNARRNLVWSLEKLCFWQNTFVTAATLMMKFAGAENETWANNATGQFLQLFHVWLSGTQAPAKERLIVIDFALNSTVWQERELGLKALGEGLTGGHFSRSGGVETQGSGAPKKDWEPQYWNEVFEYWHECLVRLTDAAVQQNGEAVIAKKLIATHIRTLVRYGQMDELHVALQRVVKSGGPLWVEAVEAIQQTLRFDSKDLPAEGIARLNEWLSMLSPQTMAQKVILYVSHAPWNSEKKGDTYIDLSQLRAEEFAVECAADMPQLYGILGMLFRGEQRQGYAFGRKLVSLLGTEEVDVFLTSCLSAMREIPNAEANSSVLAGALYGLRTSAPQLVESILEECRLDPDLIFHLPELTRVSGPTIVDLERILDCIDDGSLPSGASNILAYGGTMARFEPSQVINLCRRVAKQVPHGPALALNTVYMYCFNEPEKLQQCASILRELLLSDGLLVESSHATSVFHTWLEVVKLFITPELSDVELAEHLTREIISACGNGIDIGALEFLKPLISSLLTHYSQISWPIFGDALINLDGEGAFWLRSVFEVRVGDMPSLGLLSNVPNEVLIAWCENYPQDAPVLLPRLCTLFSNGNWTELAEFLFTQYGGREEVLSSVLSSMGPHSWTGSSIPYYEWQIEAIRKLEVHSNPSVRLWAAKVVTALLSWIEREREREEELNMGYFEH